MRRPKDQLTGGEDLLVGIDLHKNRWHVTIRAVDLELFSASIPGTWEALRADVLSVEEEVWSWKATQAG